MAALKFEEHRFDVKEVEALMFSEEKPISVEDEVISKLTEHNG